ncbi:MAG: hypothetical protein IJ213_02550 [Bacteroidales bacterium]|nr:hypothetical protein [Bacteroidales bacterium]MBQ9311905.1 hypothetical protein [Bacteroidales bacterium]
MYGEMVLLRQEVNRNNRRINDLIDKKIRWQYSEHPNLSNVEIQQKLDSFDEEIDLLKKEIESMLTEIRDIKRMMNSF